jgi:integrase
MTSYQVKFWDVKKIGDTAKGRWRVRWAVAGREHCKSFAAKPLADGFLIELKNAAHDHQPFDETTGLPAQSGRAARSRSWYDHARAYAEMKWPHLAPKSRRSTAEALTTVTLALATRRRGAPGPKTLNRALFAWAFNPGTRRLTPPEDIAAALDWAAAASPPVSALDDPAVLRAVLGACARTRAGKPAAATTQRRKRSVFYNAVGYAVEQGLLDANPIDRIQWKAPEVAETVDRRVVASPAQARALLATVRAQGSRGEHLEAFYGCLYYAALRPSEAVALREADCHLPSRGWGRIDLAASEPRAGRDWTDHGTARQARGLKHRAAGEIRSMAPSHPPWSPCSAPT